VKAAAFSPKGDLLLTGCRDGKAYLWSVHDGKRRGNALAHDAEIWAVAFSPDGETVLTGGWDKLARAWDVATQMPRRDPLLHDSPVMALAPHPVVGRIVTGSRNKMAWLWDSVTHERVDPPMVHGGPVYAAVIDPAGSLLLTAGGEGRVRFWDSSTLLPLAGDLQHDAPIHSLAVSVRGEFLLGSDAHDCLRWDLTSRTVIGRLPQEGPCKSVAYSPDGSHVIAGGPRLARLWKLSFPSPGESEPSSLPHDPLQALLSIEVCTGFELDEQGAPHAIDVAQWTLRRELLERLLLSQRRLMSASRH
jgi:WD40 repeat protein